MRKCLRAFFRLEKTESSLKYPTYPYSFEEDANAVRIKLSELQKLITDFSDDESSSSFLKISSKLAHVFQRVERST